MGPARGIDTTIHYTISEQSTAELRPTKIGQTKFQAYLLFSLSYFSAY